ncbi:MAG: tRNA (adenosine(37)-N6)-threonylcarbamoyltransferase complex ATPase subunit type 1 TsaE [Candidatus Margulisiibacteriota bacterium]
MATKFNQSILINSIDDLSLFSKNIAPHFKAPMIFGLQGGMGTGKTTFIRTLGETLGSQDWINSPTYSIIQRYSAPEFNLLHIDLYRTQSDTEIDLLDIPSQINDQTLVFIEWIDKTTLFDIDIHLHFHTINKDQRRINISSNRWPWIDEIK